MVSSVIRRSRRTVTTLMGVAVAGALLGAIVGAIAAAVGSSAGSLLPTGEHPSALRYAMAVASKDVVAADAVRPVGPVAARAREIKDAEANKRYEATALAFLGGTTSGPVSVWVYVIEETDPDVGLVRAPLVLTVRDGIVLRQRP